MSYSFISSTNPCRVLRIWLCYVTYTLVFNLYNSNRIVVVNDSRWFLLRIKKHRFPVIEYNPDPSQIYIILKSRFVRPSLSPRENRTMPIRYRTKRSPRLSSSPAATQHRSNDWRKLKRCSPELQSSPSTPVSEP